MKDGKGGSYLQSVLWIMERGAAKEWGHHKFTPYGISAQLLYSVHNNRLVSKRDSYFNKDPLKFKTLKSKTKL